MAIVVCTQYIDFGLNLLQNRCSTIYLSIPQKVDRLCGRSSHVETCCLLVRECANDDEMVSIKVDLEGISLDQGKFVPDEKPIYGNIKKWIKEKYGFNVTNLYIGQIKDKMGLEKRLNYNMGVR